MNLGTIVEAPLLKVRYAGRGGGNLGEVEESFVNMMTPGDTFMFAGRLLRFVRIRETTVEVADGGTGEPMVPAYAGARQPLTTNLADRVRSMLHDPQHLVALSGAGAGMARTADASARNCPARTTCWSRPSRATGAGSWSPIASRAATRTRRSACC